ncbi:restriction endonuclease [Nostoc sp. CHAB 5836]|uniref:restriction endonuclease n=1 Tax=Nostoc sp. CHAB 5836 TaxID=2780404 RepID=UPI001E506BA9|nr:restriction endonuclease [Nostoc sp. CHAB 5836]MCC5616363.1 restriction endonuclease [Nostoc sp. CHAB 5836]
MLPSKFCQLANFPDRWQEKHLQYYLGDRLKQLGYSVQLEVGANGGRADIVTNWQGGAIVEVKKYLGRNEIYQAVGQLNLYGLNNKHKLVVMGFLTPDAREQPSALKTASMIEQDSRIKVVFVNLDEVWQPGYSATPSWFTFKLPSLPTLGLLNWHLLWNLGKAHPMLWVFAIALFLGAAPSLQNQLQVNQQNIIKEASKWKINKQPIKQKKRTTKKILKTSGKIMMTGFILIS